MAPCPWGTKSPWEKKKQYGNFRTKENILWGFRWSGTPWGIEPYQMEACAEVLCHGKLLRIKIWTRLMGQRVSQFQGKLRFPYTNAPKCGASCRVRIFPGLSFPSGGFPAQIPLPVCGVAELGGGSHLHKYFCMMCAASFSITTAGVAKPPTVQAAWHFCFFDSILATFFPLLFCASLVDVFALHFAHQIVLPPADRLTSFE